MGGTARSKGGSARRTNRVIALVSLVLIAAAALSALVGDRSPAGTSSSTTTTPSKPQVDGTGTRPAETSRSWFDHGTAREQFDYKMDELSCDEMDTYLTVDLCAVATATSGSFMLVGTESFWEPTDKDSDGFAWIPFDLTAYTMRRDGTSRAISVLDGYTEKAHTSLKVKLDLYRAEVDGDEVLVLVKRMADGAGDPYDYIEEVQVLAASPTGAPTLVASYSGADIEVSSTGTSLVVSSRRYASPVEGNAEEVSWYSLITLSPSDDDTSSWNETITSGVRPKPASEGMTLVDSYSFPSRRGANEPRPADA